MLANSGATDNFICQQLLKRLQISYIPVQNPIKIWNVNGTHNQGGTITHYTNLQVQMGTESKILHFLITNLGWDKVILGYPWFTTFEPKIQWREATLEEEFQPVVVTTINIHKVTTESAIQAPETYKLDEDTWEQLMEEEEEPYISLQKMTTASELAQKVMDHTIKTFEQMVSEQYLLNLWNLNNPMGKWPNGETCPKGEMAQRGKCGSTQENDQTGVWTQDLPVIYWVL